MCKFKISAQNTYILISYPSGPFFFLCFANALRGPGDLLRGPFRRLQAQLHGSPVQGAILWTSLPLLPSKQLQFFNSFRNLLILFSVPPMSDSELDFMELFHSC